MYRAVANKVYSMNKRKLKSSARRVFQGKKIYDVEVIPLKNAAKILGALSANNITSDLTKATANKTSNSLLKKGAMVLVMVNGDLRLVRSLALFDNKLDRRIEEVVSRHTLPSTESIIKEVTEKPKRKRVRERPPLPKQATPLRSEAETAEDTQQRVFSTVFGDCDPKRLVLEMTFSPSEEAGAVQSTLSVQQASESLVNLLKGKNYLSMSAHAVNEDFFSGNLTDDKSFVFAHLGAPSGCIYVDKLGKKYVSCFFSDDRQELESINEALGSNFPIIYTPADISDSVCKKYALFVSSRKLIEGFLNMHFRLTQCKEEAVAQGYPQKDQKEGPSETNYIY
jgi:hypothetical protein